ncbi:DUF3800 domain-containing protein [Pseudokineococcus sp. 1T1Z-3]|uniref:DUF3800 domain-containing protein n=1 Tax=Pseudokineococcus sp. 1T1Z-3 TaxID=3132745 RepID=UPI0030A4DA23
MTYVDETGIDQNAPVAVMVGIVADVHHIARSQDEFGDLFDELRKYAGALREVKSSELMRGTGKWKHMNNADRVELVKRLCGWVATRHHRLALAAVTTATVKGGPAPAPGWDNAWRAAAWHIALQVQRAHQGKPKNKGRSLLIFDDNKKQADNFAESMINPAPWTDAYYERGKKQAAMDQIIDTPLTVASHHVGLVQIADLYAGIFRRYADLQDHGASEHYTDEARHIGEYVDILTPSLLATANRWAKRPSNPCMQWYVDVAPLSLKALT